jgi:hypothetical protein
MSHDSSSRGSDSIFNFDTQVGVTQLLASIRASALTPEQKNELRDLVFLYTNGGKDQRVRLSLEQKITTYHLAAVPTKAAAQFIQQPTIGKYRVAPSFTVPKVSIATEAAPAIPTPPRFTTPPPWQQATVSEVPKKQTPSVDVPAIDIVSPVVTTPPPTVPQNTVSNIDTSSDEAILRRIREIKALVNEKVGNPVNLVDINNEVGREYMAALLDAMKKLNGGGSIAPAMQRLEAAYAAVETTLAGRSGISANTKEMPTYTPVSTPDTEPAVSLPIERPAPPPVVPKMPAQPVEVYAPNATDWGMPNPFVPPPQVRQASVSAVPKVDIQPRETMPAVQSTTPAPHTTFSPLSEIKEKPHTINDIPTASSLRTASTVGDPLSTKEVDDGLNQLLAEWSIFKKSGLFGTGPKGHEHPLYKKISSLQIPLLLAGRFEGATQEIKQSITDYMNGWRYEQGLIYEQGETFEHYLRRVIRHILDLQNQ